VGEFIYGLEMLISVNAAECKNCFVMENTFLHFLTKYILVFHFSTSLLSSMTSLTRVQGPLMQNLLSKLLACLLLYAVDIKDHRM